MKIPLNRWIAFAGPYIATASGFIAAWLVAKANLLGIKGLDQANIATQVSGALAFLVTSGLTWAGHSKWLKGHQIMLAGAVAQGKGALVGVKASSLPSAGTSNPPGAGVVYYAPGFGKPILGTVESFDEPGDHFDGLPHHPVTDPASIPPDAVDSPTGTPMDPATGMPLASPHNNPLSESPPNTAVASRVQP